MPVQSTKTGYINFPDGGKVSVKESGGSWYDIGAVNSAVNFTLNYSENQVNTANAGKLAKQIRDMLIDGSLTLINLEPDAIEKMGGGMFEVVTSSGSTVSDIDNQVISSGWSDQTLYSLELNSTSEGTIRTASAPTITSVTLAAGEIEEEVLVEGTTYFVVEDGNSEGGWAIHFDDDAMTETSPTNFDITIVYGTNTPISGTTIYAGTSTKVLTAYGLKVEHTDSASEIDRSFEIYSANPTSGGFQFNFKGANEDGVEEMPITFQGDLDIDRADGRQLFSYFTKE